MTASFMEIYNEELRDLLDTTKGKVLRVREDENGSASVQGAEEEKVTSAEQMMEALRRGSLVRTRPCLTSRGEGAARSRCGSAARDSL